MSFSRAIFRLTRVTGRLNSRAFSSRCTCAQNSLSDRVLLRHAKRQSLVAVVNQCSRGLSVSVSRLSEAKAPENDVSKTSEEFFIPEPPLPPAEVSPEMLFNHLGEPTFASLDIGTSYFPSDFILKFLEFLHVNCELPWWGVLSVATLTVRLCLFPLVINFRRKQVAFSNNMPTLKRLSGRMEKARIHNNILEMQRVSKEIDSYKERNELPSIMNLMLFPAINITIILSFLGAIRRIANYPIASMQEGGLSWFADLTLPDPYCILPVLCVGSIFAVMEFGVDMTQMNQYGRTSKMVMRALPLVGFFFIMNMPAAVTYYFTINSCLSIAQTLTLRTKACRTFLKIPDQVVHPEEKKEKKGFWETFTEERRRSEMLRLVTERERLDDRRFRDAGKAMVKKTVPWRPKKESERAAPLRKA